MQAVMNAEKELGRSPKDVSSTKGIGYDIESTDIEGNLFYRSQRKIDSDSITLTTMNDNVQKSQQIQTCHIRYFKRIASTQNILAMLTMALQVLPLNQKLIIYQN